MRQFAIFALAFSVILPVFAEPPKTEEEKTLYALGTWLGSKIEVFSLSEKELAFVNEGLRDTTLGKTPVVSLEQYGEKINALHQERVKKVAETQKKKGAEYAAKFKKEKGVKAHPSGLMMLTVKEGSGATPKESDRVKVHYHGTFTDGKVFDSSIGKDPVEFGVTGVIKCWTEALQKMKVGGKAKLFCPSDIAYGDGGRPGIPGGAALTFEVELLDILK